MTVPALTKKQRKPIIIKSHFLLARKLVTYFDNSVIKIWTGKNCMYATKKGRSLGEELFSSGKQLVASKLHPRLLAAEKVLIF